MPQDDHEQGEEYLAGLPVTALRAIECGCALDPREAEEAKHQNKLRRSYFPDSPSYRQD